jgi:hypothetical protein
MNRWTPPKGSQVVFSINAIDGPYHPSIVPPGGLTVEACRKLRSEFFRPFGLSPPEIGHETMDLDDPRWPGLLDRLADPAFAGLLTIKACWVEEPPPRPDDPLAWFELSPGPTEFRSPAKAPKSMHFGWREGVLYASGRFRDIVKNEGLSGLGWLPMENADAGDPAWYEVYAEHPLGRGLDHPLIDRARLEEAKARDNFDPARRWGEPVAWARMFRSDASIEHPVFNRLKAVSPPAFFRVDGPRRYVREHLPEADFAYCGWGFNRDTSPGYQGRPIRSICCSAGARQALIRGGVVKASRFETIAIIPAAAADVEILDRIIPHPLPPPVYTPREAAAERARRAAIPSRPISRPRTFATIQEALAELEHRIMERSATWRPARQHTSFPSIINSELFAKMPESWRRVAPLLPMSAAADGAEPFEFEMSEPAWNDWLDNDRQRDPDDAPSTSDLAFGRTDDGDWFAVRMDDPLLPADARVVHWDHETASIKDEWPTVAAFVAEIIAACDRAAQSESE